MTKRTKQMAKPAYKIAIHTRHPSGIGSKFIRYEYTDQKPDYDSCWFDCTNGEWARYDMKPYNVYRLGE